VSDAEHHAGVNGARLGAVVRVIRLRKRLRQSDVARIAGASQSMVSRLERGHLDTLTLRQLEAICTALEIRIDLVPRWRGGDLDRALNSAHAAMHEGIARWFRRRWPRWALAPEVSFAVYAERGVIDILAWHAPTRTLLIIELKTELVDLNELVGTADRKRRLAARVGAERGWRPATVGVWVVVSMTSANRRRLEAHSAFLRNAFPHTRREVREWLARPNGPLAALSLETFGAGEAIRRAPKRVRVRPDLAPARSET
jgi:transcriptional regulator with XRE-family HTH domain